MSLPEGYRWATVEETEWWTAGAYWPIDLGHEQIEFRLIVPEHPPAEERRRLIEDRLAVDIAVTCVEHGAITHGQGAFVAALVADAMHQIDPLLIEIEGGDT